MKPFAKKVMKEFRELLPPTIYFFIVLHIIALIRSLMLRGTGIPVSSSMQIFIGALILGKAVLLANLLPFINRFPEKPLLWNICWKTLLYFVVASLIHYLEHLYDFWKEAPGFVAANQKLLSEMVWAHYWAIQIVLLVLIFMYCTTAELVRVIGRDKFVALFFGSPAARSTPK